MYVAKHNVVEEEVWGEGGSGSDRLCGFGVEFGLKFDLKRVVVVVVVAATFLGTCCPFHRPDRPTRPHNPASAQLTGKIRPEQTRVMLLERP